MIEQTEEDFDELFSFGKDDPAVPELVQLWRFKRCVLCGCEINVQRPFCDPCRASFNHIEPSSLRRMLARNLWLQVRMLGLFATADLPTIMFDLIKIVHDLYGFDRVGAYLVDNDSRRIRGIGFLGLPKRYIENFDISIESDDPEDRVTSYGMIRHVALTGERIIVNDRSGDPRYVELTKTTPAPDRTPAQCLAVFPLMSKVRGKVVGIVSVSNMPTHSDPQITDEKIGMLELLLSYASLSIQTAKAMLDKSRAEEAIRDNLEL